MTSIYVGHTATAHVRMRAIETELSDYTTSRDNRLRKIMHLRNNKNDVNNIYVTRLKQIFSLDTSSNLKSIYIIIIYIYIMILNLQFRFFNSTIAKFPEVAIPMVVFSENASLNRGAFYRAKRPRERERDTALPWFLVDVY